MNRYPVGYLCVDGRFRIERRVWGPFYEGIQLSDGSHVVVAHGEHIRDPERARRQVERNQLLVPSYLGFGTIDIKSWRPGPGETEADADYWEEGDETPAGEYVCVESAPGGVPLAAVRSALHIDDAIRAGVGLCQHVSAAQKMGLQLCSIRPETVWFVEKDGGRWSFTGITPRGHDLVMCGHYPPSSFDLWDSWLPPDAGDEQYGGAPPNDTDVFATAALVWFAATGKYPFGDPGPAATTYDPKQRRPFDGPRELAEVLEPVLMFDGTDRAPLETLQARLLRLAEARGLSLSDMANRQNEDTPT
jgi:hypothetical protein